MGTEQTWENMTWQEEVLAVEELKQIYEKLYGWNSNSGRPMKNRSSDDRFSTNKLARELKISKGKIVQDLQLAEAIKKYPEIRECKKKTEALRKLRRIKRYVTCYVIWMPDFPEPIQPHKPKMKLLRRGNFEELISWKNRRKSPLS